MTPATSIDLVRRFLRDEGVPEDQIASGLAQWAVVPFQVGGDRNAAAILLHGCEIHLVLAPRHRGKGRITRARVRSVLAPILEEYGFVTTRIGKGDGRHRLFIDRLGFKRTWSDERFSYFMLTELPFGKRKQICHP